MKNNLTCNFDIKTYYNSKQIDLDINCNSFNVENTGDTIISIRGKQLLPGDPTASPIIPGQNISFNLNEGEVFYPNVVPIDITGTGTQAIFQVSQIFYNQH